ncbi:MAG: hypothetical protein H7Y18_02605 [Clostridiaceae bacterium]|nr:hypothetical protein [Clostridiaceae bacterium]
MDKKRTRQYAIRLGCLFASFTLWLYIYNVVNPIKETKLREVVVELKNTEALAQFKLTLIPNEKYNLNLTLTGSADDLQNIPRDKFKLVADLEGFGFKKGDVNRIPVKIIQKPDNVQVSNSDMLYINIRTDELIEKSLPVKPEMTGKVKVGYFAFPTTFNPTEVLVTGPAKLVNKVTSTLATISIASANLNVESTITLKAVDENGTEVKDIVLNPKEVKATTVVKKIKSIPVIVKTKGALGKSYILKSIVPSEENIEIAVDEKNENSITSIETVPLALDTLAGSSEKQLNLVVPDGVKLISNKGSVGVKITMAKIITKNVAIDIKIKNLSDTLSVTLDKTKVNLVVSGDEGILNGIKDGDIECSIDLNTLAEVASLVVPVTIKLPAGVTVVSQAPQTVTVAIIKK